MASGLSKRSSRWSSSDPSRRLGHAIIEPNGKPIHPRDAAILIVWRRNSADIEVLMGRRSRKAAFVPDYFVFPGGRLDPADYTVGVATPLNPAFIGKMGVRGSAKKAEALAIAAVRETFEETGLLAAETGTIGEPIDSTWNEWKQRGLAPALSHLEYFGRAITSRLSPIRFNARFFITRADVLEGHPKNSAELTDVEFYPIDQLIDRMPILDVTEFMLRQLIQFAENPSSIISQPPLFSYKHDASYVHYSVHA
jgi:8-oxo-dGTP pyrophosphatase MutT (NUDIX family)